MAVVSIDIDAMVAYVAALESAISSSTWSAASLQSKCTQAGEWDSDCASFNGGESTRQLDALLMDARRRLALAQLVAASVPGGLSVVDIDDSYLSMLSREEVGEVVDQVISLLDNGTGEITQELVDLLAQNSIDPYFAQELANRLSPKRLAECLAQINQYHQFNIITREQTIPYNEMYNSLLYALAGSYSLAAQGTGDVEVPGFTTTWQNAIKEMDNPLWNQQVLLLSLVIERGQWPDEFLSGVYDTIRDLEGTDGIGHWVVGGPDLVIDPWPPQPDPDTGTFTIADDPMAGLLAAMANNPELVGKLFNGGPPTTINTGNGTQADVDSRLWWMIHDRGASEYTINALMLALSGAVGVPPVEGEVAWQANLVTDLEAIVKAFEEEGRVADAAFKRSIPHTILDLLGFIPVVGAVPDAINAVWYAVEGDWGNAALSGLGAIPFVGYAVVGGKWVKKALTAADLVKISDSASMRKVLAGIDNGTSTAADVLRLTDPALFRAENMLSARDLARFSGKREFLRNLVAGNMFNKLCNPKYGDFNEISVLKTGAGRYTRVDAIVLGRWVVSRKFTQLSEIQFDTAVRYLDEFDTKYPPGARLPSTPKNIALGIADQQLPNWRYLEVPPQAQPIPREILENAVRREPPIAIFDSTGVELTAQIRAELNITIDILD